MPDIFYKTINDAVTQDTQFVKTVTEAERLLATIVLNGWDQPGAIVPDMLVDAILEITPVIPGQTLVERRIAALVRLGEMLRAFQALRLWLDTPIPGLAAPAAPEAALRSLDLAQAERGVAPDTAITPRYALWRGQRG